MSLDIALHRPRGADGYEEVVAMNWLRNSYGLIYWVQDNIAKPTEVNLWFVCNEWNYDNAPKVNRKLFKQVVDAYAPLVDALEEGYFWFGAAEYTTFVEPHGHLIPRSFQNKPRGAQYDGHRIGIPMEYFRHEAFNLGIPRGQSVLGHYKLWYLDLVDFANLLQDESLDFYCSN